MIKFIGLALIALCSVSKASVLSNLASTMTPGTWRAVTSNLNYGMVHAGPTMDFIWAYGSRCHWDPISKQILYIGSAHGAPSNFIAYTDSNNTWRLETTCREPQTTTNRYGHSYDMRTMDSHTGKYWIHTYNGPSYLFTYHAPTNTWDSVASLGTFDQSNMNSIAYFPDIKKIVAYSGKDGAIRTLDPLTKTWTYVQSASANGFEVVICYNDKYHCMILGGGENSSGTAIYALDTNLQLRSITTAPVRIGAMGSELTCDPGSGEILVSTGVSIRAYSLESNSWRTIPISPASLSTFSITGANSIIGTIPEYNCHVLLNVSSYGMLLYKHSSDSLLDSEKSISHKVSGNIIHAQPNPFSSSIRFSFNNGSQKASFNIYDLRGKLVKKITVNNHTIDWNGYNQESVKLAPGAYVGIYKDLNGHKESIRLSIIR